MSDIIDATDRKIIALLQQDGRTSNVDLARALGLAEATIRKRLEKLFVSEIIRVRAVVDPVKLGFALTVVIGVEVELSQLATVVTQIAAIDEVKSVRAVTGQYDAIIEAALRSEDDLYPFLTTKIATIPGVRRTHTSHVLTVAKQSCDYLGPATPDDG